MTETPKLLLEKDGPIGWIIFNQPEKRNAVSQEMWELMPDYVHDLATDDAIRVVVLRGAGDQAFVAGADISQFKDRRRNMADEEEYRRISGRGQDALAALSKPLLAMIHGYCVGGGVSIAIGCDIRIAADDARFGIPAARLGLGYHYSGMEQLMAENTENFDGISEVGPDDDFAIPIVRGGSRPALRRPLLRTFLPVFSARLPVRGEGY